MAFTSPDTINTSKGLPEFFSYVNEVTYSWFSNMIIISIWLILVIVYGRSSNDWWGAIAIAGFGTFIVSLLFYIGGFITGYTFAVAIAMMLIGVFSLFQRD